MMHLDRLPAQKKNEKVILFLRRHWFAVAKIVIAFVLLIGIPAAIGIVLGGPLERWLDHEVYGPLILLASCTYVLAVWLFAFLEYTDYYLDTWILTNERIINIEQEGLFHRTASELHLAAVQDVTAETRGMLQTFVNYGDVHVQTAGGKHRFVFRTIGHPERVKEQIIRLVETYKRLHGVPEVSAKPRKLDVTAGVPKAK